jgi:hypothetical protein
VNAGYAPYLDYTPLTAEQLAAAQSLLGESWLGEGLESRASAHAIKTIVPEHLREVKSRREALIDKTLMQVKARLLSEIRYWDQRAVEIRAQEEAGRNKGSLNSNNARQRADELSGRLQKRESELNRRFWAGRWSSRPAGLPKQRRLAARRCCMKQRLLTAPRTRKSSVLPWNP